MKSFLFISACLFSLMFTTQATAQVQQLNKEGDERVIYKYKKYQKFDFENLEIEGDTGNPGDLSVSPRFQKRFENKLPYRKNFNAEIRKGIERIR